MLLQSSSVQFVLTRITYMFSTHFIAPAMKPKVQTRKCEVAFPYTPLNEDELALVVGETIEILREVIKFRVSINSIDGVLCGWFHVLLASFAFAFCEQKWLSLIISSSL